MTGFYGLQLAAARRSSFFTQPTGGGAAGMGDMGAAGYAGMIVGAIVQAAGVYYSAEAQRAQLKSQAMSLQFQERMAAINARAAEADAQVALEAGQHEISRLTMGVGAAKAARRARSAAAGVRLGVGGSAAEEEASEDLVKQIDVLTIRRNAARAAGAARTRGVNAANVGLLAGVSAENVGRTARSLQPGTEAGIALASSAASTALQLSRDRRLATYIGTL